MSLKTGGALTCAAIVLAGCTATPVTKSDISTMSSIEICKLKMVDKPIDPAGRAIFGVLTLGMSELNEASLRNNQSMYNDELSNRGISSCSSQALASYDCKSIFGNLESLDYKNCVLQMSNAYRQELASTENRLADRRQQGALNALQIMQQQQQQQQQPTNINCYRLGQNVNCTAY